MQRRICKRNAFLGCVILVLLCEPGAGADGTGSLSGLQSLSAVSARDRRVSPVKIETDQSAVEKAVEEFVEIRAGEGRVQRWRGEIVNFSGTGLILRLSDGTEKHFPVERVVSYSPNSSSLYREANKRLAEGAVTEALGLFVRARTAESREWRRREITADIVRCYHALGDYVRAGEEFVDRLVVLDSQSPFVWCVPLAWFPEETLALAEPRARNWLNSDLAWVQLLAASYLLDSPAASQAVTVLERLRSSTDETVAILASAQLWRRGWQSVQPNQLSQWENVIERLPARLKSGPCYLLGLAWKQQGAFDRAMVWLLRPPFLWPENRRVAARCLWEAAELAGKSPPSSSPDSAAGSDHQHEYQAIVKNLVERFPESPWAAQVRAAIRSNSLESGSPVRDGP